MGRPLFGISFALFALFLVPVLNLGSLGSFYSGGRSSFYRDTVGSLVSSFLYDTNYASTLLPFLSVVVVGAVVVAVVWTLGKIRTRIETATAFFFLSILLTIAVSEILQFYILKTPYVMGRYAIYFCLIYAYFVTFFLAEAAQELKQPFQKVVTGLVILLAVFQGLHFAQSANLKYIREWRFDAGAKSFLATLDDNVLVKQRIAADKGVRLGLFWPFHPSLRYYLAKSPRPWLIVDFDKTDDVRGMLLQHTDYDFLYVDNRRPVDEARIKYHIVAYFPESGTYLLSVDRPPSDRSESQ